MRRFARSLLVLSTFVVVLGLGKMHAVGHEYDYSGSARLGWSIAYAALLVLAAYAAGLPDLTRSRRSALSASLASTAGAALAMSILQLAAGSALLPRFVILMAPAILLPIYILCSRLSADGQVRAGERDRVVAVATLDEGIQLGDELAEQPERPAVLARVLSPEDAVSNDPSRHPLLEAVSSTQATAVILDRKAQADESIVAQAARLHEAGVRVRTLSLFYEEWLGKLPVSELERVSLMFDIGELHRARYGRMKRLLDGVAALMGLLVLLFVTPVVLLGNRFANHGPLLYRQPRVGKNGRAFQILKFRTMSPGNASSAWTTADDARITPFGAWLRRSHLDELPQVVNILRGDLSVVGPRPEQPRYVEELQGKIPFYGLRHLVRPGLTGWAQVKYPYGASELDALEKLQYDFYYLRHQGLGLDVRIIGRTLRSVTRTRRAMTEGSSGGRMLRSVKRRLTSHANVTLGTSAVLTLVVRGLGLAGQVLLLTIFGAGVDVAGYFIALLLPQLVVVPIAGAVETALAPPYARLRAEDPRAAAGFRRRVIRISALVTVPLAVGAAFVAPVAVYWIAPGAQAAELNVAASVASLLFASLAPQVMAAVASGLLFGAGRYQAPILAGAANPLAMLVILLLLPDTDIVGIAVASMIGSVVQAVIVLWHLRRVEGPALPSDRSPDLAPVLRSMGSLVMTYFVAQAIPVMDQAFVSSLGASALATFVIALRFVDVAKAVIILPNTRMAQTRMALLATSTAEKFRAHVGGEVRRAIKVGFASAVLLVVGGPLIVRLFFQHGEFTASDTGTTIYMISILALVLVPASVALVLPRALVALNRTGLYFAFAVGQVVLNLSLDALLIGPFGAAGIAAASGVNFLVTSILVWFAISRCLGQRAPERPLTPAGVS